MSNRGLAAIRDAAREYVTARVDREIAREAWREATVEKENYALRGEYLCQCRRVRNALARLTLLLAVEPRVLRAAKEES